MADPESDIAEHLRRYVTAWVARVAPRIRDEMCHATITIRLDSPQGEEDGMLYLDSVIDETITADRSGGRVTGMRFDPIPAPRPAADAIRCSVRWCDASCETNVIATAMGWKLFDSGWCCLEHVPF